MPQFTYLLGDGPGELARLRAQARLWDPVSHALFDRLRVARGWKVLEIGPGQGSLHLELRRRVGGPADAVEHSPVVASRLQKLVRRDGLGAGRIWTCDLIDADLPDDTYDLIFARWVFLFLPEARAYVRKMARALKPGGLLAIQDYHFDTFMLAPCPDDWADFVAAHRAFFASRGGHASIGPQLPRHYRAVGLDLVDIDITTMAGHPGSTVWKWITTYTMGVMNRYAAFPPFSRAKAARLRRAWQSASRDRASLLIGPALLDVVGRKSARRGR